MDAFIRGMRYLVSKARDWTDVPIEVHCHNDFGLGVANSIAGVEEGPVPSLAP